MTHRELGGYGRGRGSEERTGQEHRRERGGRRGMTTARVTPGQHREVVQGPAWACSVSQVGS